MAHLTLHLELLVALAAVRLVIMLAQLLVKELRVKEIEAGSVAVLAVERRLAAEEVQAQ